jgi:hypothetical protein
LATSILAGEAPFAYLIFPLRLVVIHVPFVDVTGPAIKKSPGFGVVRADANGRAVDQGRHHPLTLAGRVEQPAAGRLGAAFGLRVADALPALALVGGAEHAAVAEVDPDVASVVIDDDATEAAEAGLLTPKQVGDNRLPLRIGGQCWGGEDEENQRNKTLFHGRLLLAKARGGCTRLVPTQDLLFTDAVVPPSR